MISLEQIRSALISLGVGDDRVAYAIAVLKELLLDLDQVEVKGRQKLDTLLGCMMSIEAIIGEKRCD